jgi:hypothetical protein
MNRTQRNTKINRIASHIAAKKKRLDQRFLLARGALPARIVATLSS